MAAQKQMAETMIPITSNSCAAENMAHEKELYGISQQYT